jgi:hypothetical protein
MVKKPTQRSVELSVANRDNQIHPSKKSTAQVARTHYIRVIRVIRG